MGLAHIREHTPGTGAGVAVAALSGYGRAALVLDLHRLAMVRDPGSVVTVAAREALLRGAGLVAGPVEGLAESALDAVHRLSWAGVPVVLVGTATWDPQWSAEAPLLTDAPALGGRERRSCKTVRRRRATHRSRTPWLPPI